jgi:hypothetical protein
MIGYRLTKYDPAYRDEYGAFLSEDWTSVSDIGRRFGNNILSIQNYLIIEGKYCEAVQQLLLDSRVNSMRISNLEIRTHGTENIIGDGLAGKCLKLLDDTIVTGTGLETVIRGCLREYIWCRLCGPKGSYIHFGYDFYVYVGVLTAASTKSIPEGLFLEQFESPYMNLDD